MTTANTTQVTPITPKIKGTSSIRTRILLLSALPALAIALSWFYVTLNVQAKNDRNLLLTSVTQTAKTFSERIIDLEENLSLTLEDEELITNAQVRAEETIRNSALPLTDIAVFDGEGKPVVVFSKTFPEGISATENQDQIIARWKKDHPDIAQAMEKLAGETLQDIYLSQEGFSQNVNIGNKRLTLAASVLPGGEGVTITSIDETFLKSRVQNNIIRSLLILGSVLLMSLALASIVAGRLIGRIQRLSQATEAVSEGQLSTPIPISGNDELTSLGQSIDLLKESTIITLEHSNA